MKVAVVGLGAAGLRAAMLLERAGAEVQLFEARDRLGGRIRTVREGDVVYDAGGEWLDSDHRRCLALLHEIGIEPDPTSAWPGKVVFDGEECKSDTLWVDALEDDLRVEAAAREMCRDLDSVPWKNLRHPEWDSRTLEEFLCENTSSARGLWWVCANYRSDEGDDPDRIGLLGWLCGYLHYLDRDAHAMSAYRAPNGMDAIIDGMAATLKAKVHRGAVLHRVIQDSECVRLHFAAGENTRRAGFEVETDRVILTLPPPAIEQVGFQPALSSAKRCAIEACEMSKAIKIAWEFDRPWWQEAGWNGSLMVNGPLQQLWDAGRGSAPVLAAYVCGRDALALLREPEPVSSAFERLKAMFPQAESSFKRGWLHNWVSERYSFGAFSHLAPGYVLGHMRHIGSPHGRVHFAGEHTALWTGFIEGAFESAERVVDEVLNA